MPSKKLLQGAALVALPVITLGVIAKKSPGDAGTLIGIIAAWTICGCLYFLPALIAQRRGHHQASAIAVLNLFLGWTVLGWIGALIWACTATPGNATAAITVQK